MTETNKPVEEGAGRTGWLLLGFFAVLLAINAAFFAVALSNPPEPVDSSSVEAPRGSGD